jgi:hypothetical protein
MTFSFDIYLGDYLVKSIRFPENGGRRLLTTSTGQPVGLLTLTDGKLKLELDQNAAQLIVDAQFH